jgi:hypothetical protein
LGVDDEEQQGPIGKQFRLHWFRKLDCLFANGNYQLECLPTVLIEEKRSCRLSAISVGEGGNKIEELNTKASRPVGANKNLPLRLLNHVSHVRQVRI